MEANIVESATRQQNGYNSGEAAKLTVGRKVLVSNSNRGKLDPQ